MFQKILVAIDNSVESKQALSEAITLAKANGAEVMLLNVLTQSSQDYPDPVIPAQARTIPAVDQAEVYRTYAQQWEAFEQQGLTLLRSLTEAVTAAGIPTEFTQLFGDPSRRICELANSWEADLIVMGRRGYTGLKEMILGSTSNYVTHRAHCSVLTVQESAVSPLPGGSESVFGFKISGKLRNRDYEKFAPAVEAAIQRSGKARLLLEFEDFQGWEPQAIWDQLHFNFKLGNEGKVGEGKVDRIAIVGDRRGTVWIDKLCNAFLTAEKQYFAEISSAWAWLNEKT